MKKFLAVSAAVVVFVSSSSFSPSTESVSVEALGDSKIAYEYKTIVTVYKNGSRVGKGHKVSLEFVGLIGSFTKNYYTNSNGEAHVEHDSKGTVKVYVDGVWSTHETKGKAPGKISVYL